MSEPRRALSEPAYEFSSGELCLDFANTWSDRSRPGRDRLTSFPAYAAFLAQAGLLPAEGARRLLAAAAAAPEAAAAALGAARDLREALFVLFAGAARARPLTGLSRELATLNDWLRRALPDRRLVSRAGAPSWEWAEESATLGALLAPLRPIVLSAAELLSSDRLSRVRECDSTTCNWLFLDRSRAGSRRWCSMRSCGNRAKARRHYRRRAAGGRAS